jgi:hypothetical protein
LRAAIEQRRHGDEREPRWPHRGQLPENHTDLLAIEAIADAAVVCRRGKALTSNLQRRYTGATPSRIAPTASIVSASAAILWTGNLQRRYTGTTPSRIAIARTASIVSASAAVLSSR